jgi:hypothetical protein
MFFICHGLKLLLSKYGTLIPCFKNGPILKIIVPNHLGFRKRNNSTTDSGARYEFNLPNDLQIVVGAAVPVGLTSDSPDWGLFFYLSFEHPFMRVEAVEQNEGSRCSGGSNPAVDQ